MNFVFCKVLNLHQVDNIVIEDCSKETSVHVVRISTHSVVMTRGGGMATQLGLTVKVVL